MTQTCSEVVATLQGHASPENALGMARFGINPSNILGIPMPVLHALAKTHRRDHELALELWETGIHEARILGALVADPSKATLEELDSWVHDLDSWDTCDQFCTRLVRCTPHAWGLAFAWSRDEREFVKRAGYVVVCTLAVHDKRAPDERFVDFFPEILRGAVDERNFVKKAVNWSIRQIGKRNARLHPLALDLCEAVLQLDTRSAKWIAADARRELTSAKTIERVHKRG